LSIWARCTNTTGAAHTPVEKTSDTLELHEKRAPGVLEAAVGAEDQTNNINDDKNMGENKDWWRRRESNPCKPKTLTQ